MDYDRRFYEGQSSGSYASANVVVPLVQKLLDIKSVCDVGCGVGTWLRCWREHGVSDVIGIDGQYVNTDQLMIPVTLFRPGNLREPIICSHQFDLAMSLEVAEHLPPERAPDFVTDLMALAPVVMFSAAVPGQGGTGHINERWQSYWVDLFAKNGMTMIDAIRPQIWDDTRVESWYRQNIMMFCRTDSLPAYPRLVNRMDGPISIVHPEEFTRRTMGVRQALAELMAASGRAITHRLSRRH